MRWLKFGCASKASSDPAKGTDPTGSFTIKRQNPVMDQWHANSLDPPPNSEGWCHGLDRGTAGGKSSIRLRSSLTRITAFSNLRETFRFAA